MPVRSRDHIEIALVQLFSEKGDIEGNLARHKAQIDAARDRGTAIALFPEMSITGYIDPARWPDAVLTLDGPDVARFLALTIEPGIVAVAGLVEANPAGKPHITQIVARDGALLAVYRKRHVVDEEADWFAAGAPTPCLFDLGDLRLGLAVCADIDEPAVYSDCARAGALLILHASAPGLYGEQEGRDWRSGYDWWRSECMSKDAAHARVNGVYVAAATAAGRTIDEDFPGGGYLFGPDGAYLAGTKDWSPGVLYATIPLAPAAGCGGRGETHG